MKRVKLRKDGLPGFNTSTGRIELYSPLAEKLGENVLPYYDEPYYSTLHHSGTIQRVPRHRHDRFPQYPTTSTPSIAMSRNCREMQPHPLVEINDVWAKEQGFRDGDWLWIENKIGRIKHRAKLTPIVQVGYGERQQRLVVPRDGSAR